MKLTRGNVYFRCPTYTKLPQVCALVTVPNKCCKEVRCGLPITTTTAIPTLSPPKFTATPPPMYNPDCHDKIDNCQAYGQTSCTGAYKPWAMRNCQRYCGLCRMYYIVDCCMHYNYNGLCCMYSHFMFDVIF